ncbi:hypothetical protein C8R44DRAFT_870798 [Mycena epipterygia]|nr:hypothetical protein C8R44DRAFT_870798 [Mycena epipterygia]
MNYATYNLFASASSSFSYPFSSVPRPTCKREEQLEGVSITLPQQELQVAPPRSPSCPSSAGSCPILIPPVFRQNGVQLYGAHQVLPVLPIAPVAATAPTIPVLAPAPALAPPTPVHIFLPLYVEDLACWDALCDAHAPAAPPAPVPIPSVPVATIPAAAIVNAAASQPVAEVQNEDEDLMEFTLYKGKAREVVPELFLTPPSPALALLPTIHGANPFLLCRGHLDGGHRRQRQRGKHQHGAWDKVNASTQHAWGSDGCLHATRQGRDGHRHTLERGLESQQRSSSAQVIRQQKKKSKKDKENIAPPNAGHQVVTTASSHGKPNLFANFDIDSWPSHPRPCPVAQKPCIVAPWKTSTIASLRVHPPLHSSPIELATVVAPKAEKSPVYGPTLFVTPPPSHVPAPATGSSLCQRSACGTPTPTCFCSDQPMLFYTSTHAPPPSHHWFSLLHSQWHVYTFNVVLYLRPHSSCPRVSSLLSHAVLHHA